MKDLTKTAITGLILAIFLFVPESLAFYSPGINKAVTDIKSHIMTSRQTNGVGSMYDAAKKLADNDKAGLNHGLFGIYWNAVKESATQDAIVGGVGEDFFLAFNIWVFGGETVTTCLRDDIWGIKTMEEAVVNEMYKAALMGDAVNANILLKDYGILKDFWKDLRGGGYKNKKKYFPSSQNYYVDCPEGSDDILSAWKDIKLSFDNMINTFSGKGVGSWGNLKEMMKAARRSAKAKAKNWIKANQIKVSLAGESGRASSRFSMKELIDKKGISGLAGDLRDRFKFAEDMAGMIGDTVLQAKWQLFDKRENITDIIDAYSSAKQAEEQALEQMRERIAFDFRFNNVSEESLKVIESKLTGINLTIKSMWDKKGGKENLLKFCEDLRKLAVKQCPNKPKPKIAICGE